MSQPWTRYRDMSQTIENIGGHAQTRTGDLLRVKQDN